MRTTPSKTNRCSSRRGTRPRLACAVAVALLLSCSKERESAPAPGTQAASNSQTAAASIAAPAPSSQAVLPLRPPPRIAAPEGSGLPAPPDVLLASKDLLAKSYQPIWKALFLRRNSMSEEQFAKQISVQSVRVEGRRSIWLKVTYDVTTEWATATRNDRLLLRVDATVPGLPDVPRDTYLDEATIGRVIDTALAAKSSKNAPYISRVIPDLKLKFSSKEAALKQMREIAGAEDLSLVTTLYVPEAENEAHPFLRAHRVVDMEKRHCMRIQLDLVTGDSTKKDRSCVAH